MASEIKTHLWVQDLKGNEGLAHKPENQPRPRWCFGFPQIRKSLHRTEGVRVPSYHLGETCWCNHALMSLSKPRGQGHQQSSMAWEIELLLRVLAFYKAVLVSVLATVLLIQPSDVSLIQQNMTQILGPLTAT